MKDKFIYYSDMIPANQYKTKLGIRGKNKKLLKKYLECLEEEESRLLIENELIENNLPLVYAVCDWWTRDEDLDPETIRDLRQDAIYELVRCIRGKKFCLEPNKFSVNIYYVVTNPFYKYYRKRYEGFGTPDIYDIWEKTNINLEESLTEESKEIFDLEDFYINLIDIVRESLKDREWCIMKNILKGITFDEIGYELGLSRERVRQIYEKSIDKLQYRKVYVYNELTGKLIGTRLEERESLHLLKRYL